jgi:hypothetical protein
MGSCRKRAMARAAKPIGPGVAVWMWLNPLPVAVIQHLKQGRIKNFLLLVFRQFVGANGRKMNDPFFRRSVLIITGNQGIGTIGLGGKVDLLLERKGDTVDFIKGVREMSQMNTLDGRCGRILFCLTEPTVKSARPGPVPW